MRVAVDISLYPLTEEFIPPIKDVIERLLRYESLDVTTNPMSTQIQGDYEAVMEVLKTEIQTTFDNLPKAVFTIRILNNPLNNQG
ncbi:MAG: YkoF family thiamine/hydroxymethylpyrimidine-binding protein [Woeseia sp.]